LVARINNLKREKQNEYDAKIIRSYV
jgi:hypothetical protein